MFHCFVAENETPGWTQLKLPGQGPSPRCGHTITSGGHYVITFSRIFVLFHLSYLDLLCSKKDVVYLSG